MCAIEVAAPPRTGRFAIIEQFLADGFEYMFGNPGTVEQGFLDAVGDFPGMTYVLTLQESVAVMIADGYARAAKRPALVQIHSTPGLGNAIGALYQANRGHAPLVVIGGDAGLRYVPMEAQMYGDLVGMARPVTKWSTMVTDPRSLLRTMRRAIKVASTPPMGPVYVCLPADVLDQPAVEPVVRTSIPSTDVLPGARWIDDAARALAGARKPVILMGDGVAYTGAQAELARVAELVGAEVWGADSGELNMDFGHPLYQGQTGHMFGPASLPITSRGDVVLIVGTYAVPEVFPELGEIFAPDATVIHVDLNAYEIGKNHRVDLGVVASPRLTLAGLADRLEAVQSRDERAAASSRSDELGAAKADDRRRQLARDAASRDSMPLTFATFAAELGRQVPADVVVFDEALTASPELTRYLVPSKPGTFFQTRGGSLGVGFPGAIGAQLANPGRTVIGFSGDGGSMYTIQALWTAAHHGIGAKFVVCNNHSYKLLKLNVQEYWRDLELPERDFPASFDIKDPDIGFAGLAQALGVPGERVERPEQVAPAVARMLGHDGPYLLDVVVSDSVPNHFVEHGSGQ